MVHRYEEAVYMRYSNIAEEAIPSYCGSFDSYNRALEWPVSSMSVVATSLATVSRRGQSAMASRCLI